MQDAPMRRIGVRSSPYPLYPAAFIARFLVPVPKKSIAPCTKKKKTVPRVVRTFVTTIVTSGFSRVLPSLLVGLRFAKTRTPVAKNSGRLIFCLKIRTCCKRNTDETARNNVCKNDSFTAPFWFYRYTDEK